MSHSLRTFHALSLVCLGAPCAAHAAEAPWYERCLVGMEVGPTGAQWGSDPRDTGYAASFSGVDIVRKQLEIGSEYLVIWGRDGEWAYYDSKRMPKCPGLGERDPLREAVEAAKPHGLPVIVYCVVQSGGHALREHPEFAMVGADGSPIPGRVCLNSPYRDFIRGLVEEMLAYGVDGFHIDMVDQGFGPPYGCWCPYCRELYETQVGKPMPSGETWDADWDRMLTFRYDTSARFERDLYDFIRKQAPGVSVDYNYHGYPPFSFEVGQRPVQHAHIGDFVTCECGVWGFGALSTGLTAEFVRASGPDRPYQVVMQRGVRFYHDQTSRPLNDLRWEMLTLLAHGAQVTIVDKTPFSGVLDPVAYGRIAEVFAEARRKRTQFGQTPYYEAGLYYSQRARDWYGRGAKEKYQQPFFGVHKAMTYAHIPAGIVLDEDVSQETLREFPVVILPNVAILSDEEVAALETYVRAGGNLVVTGQSGCYGWYGEQRDTTALERLIGATLVRLAGDHDNYLLLESLPEPLNEVADGIPLDWPHLVYGPAAVYKPTSATPYGRLVAPVRRHRQKEGKEGTTFPSSAGEAVGPGLLLNRVGEGYVLTFAVSPDAAAGGEYRTAEARKLISNAVRALHRHPLVRIEAPNHIETVVTDDRKNNVLRIHFLAYLVPPGITEPKRPWVLPEFMEDIPLYRATVDFARPIREAHALNPTSEIVRDGNQVRLQVNDVHEVLLVTYD